MKANVPSCPIDIGAFGARAVMFIPNAPSQLIEQSRLSFWYCLEHALFHVYLMLYKYTAIVPRSGAMRFACDQKNMHNGSPPCITAQAVLLNEQL